MPQPIQVGSISDRLRSFFRLRGRSGFQLDETVVPVVNVQDLDSPLYRKQEIGWHAASLAQNAVGLTPTRTAMMLGTLVLPEAFTPSPDPTGKANVQGLIITLQEDAAIVPFVLTLVSSATVVANSEGVGGVVLNDSVARDTDNPVLDPTVPSDFKPVPILARSFQATGAFLGATIPIGRFRIDSNTHRGPFVLPLDIILRGRSALMLTCATDDTAFAGMWYGTFDPTVDA